MSKSLKIGIVCFLEVRQVGDFLMFEPESSSNSHCEGCTGVFWEADGQRRLDDLVFEQVLLVKEEDDGSVVKPLVVTNRVEELQRLVHAVLQERDQNMSNGTELHEKKLQTAEYHDVCKRHNLS